MENWEKFQAQKKYTEFVTPHNFLLFIIIREYVESFETYESEFCDPDSIGSQLFATEEDKFEFYKFLIDALNNESVNPFEAFHQANGPLKLKLASLVQTKIDSFDDMRELILYFGTKKLRCGIFGSVTEEVSVTNKSVLGIFLRKFTYGFQYLSYEQVADFLERFHQCFTQNSKCTEGSSLTAETMHGQEAKELGRNPEGSADLKDSVPRDQVALFAQRTARQLNVNANLECAPVDMASDLERYKKRFPDIASLHYVSYMLAVRKKNWVEAERCLHDYFATRALPEASVDADCTYAALTCASMHYTFGHTEEAMRLEHESLEKALKSESKVALDHVKALHAVIDPLSSAFKYEGKPDPLIMFPYQEIKFTELQTDIRKMMVKKVVPKEIFKKIFESDVPLSQENLPLCLLEMSNMWAGYGYKSLAVCLAQCAIVFDCLKKDDESNDTMVHGIALIAKAYADRGKSAQAADILRKCELVYVSFPEKGVLRRAHLDIEYDQRVREGSLDQAERLVSAIRLHSAPEAQIRAAQIAKERGNNFEAQSLLQSLLVQSTEGVRPRDDALLSADLEIRARFLMVELLLDSDSDYLIEDHLTRALVLAKQCHLHLLWQLCEVYMAALCYVRDDCASAIAHVRTALPHILAEGDVTTVARVRLLYFKCLVRDLMAQGADAVQGGYYKGVQLVPQLTELCDEFIKIDSWKYKMNCLILLASLYNFLDEKENRNIVAKKYRKLHIEYYKSGEKHRVSIF